MKTSQKIETIRISALADAERQYSRMLKIHLNSDKSQEDWHKLSSIMSAMENLICALQSTEA